MVEYDPQERELVKTLDRKLVPFLAVLYLCFWLDRSVQLHTRITNPRTRAGLERDLQMTDSGFIWSLLSFSFGSLVAVLPATLAFRKVGPVTCFAICFMAWGTIAAATAGSSNWGGFLATRLFLGLAQSGFVPSILVYMVYFYTKEELATRFSYVISSATAASSVSGLFTHYISRADGSAGLAGWQWTFIMEGMIGIVMGVVTWMYLPSYPETCHFLSPADRVLAASRGRDGAEDDSNLLTTGITKTTRTPIYRFHQEQMFDVIKDTRAWLLAVSYFLISLAMDCLVVLSPEVAATSFDINKQVLRNATSGDLEMIIDDEDGSLPINLLSTAPYLIGGVIAMAVAAHSDSLGERAMHAAVPLAISSGGFGFMAILPPKYAGAGPARYFMGLLPAVSGLITALPCVLAYAMDKAQGDTYRATTAAMTVSFGQALGLVLAASPDLFRETNAPTYPIVCTICGVCVGIAAGLLMLVQWFNQQEELNMWGKAPGLRRLLNDADEAKAWDVELSNIDLLKTGTLGDGMNLGDDDDNEGFSHRAVGGPSGYGGLALNDDEAGGWTEERFDGDD